MTYDSARNKEDLSPNSVGVSEGLLRVYQRDANDDNR